jgi:hypothetical protein
MREYRPRHHINHFNNDEITIVADRNSCCYQSLDNQLIDNTAYAEGSEFTCKICGRIYKLINDGRLI